MSENQSTENVYAILGKHLCGELIDHKGPLPGLYQISWDETEDLWIAYPSNSFDYVGGTRTIVISKKTGEIRADVIVGE
jgi:hypothetical protein